MADEVNVVPTPPLAEYTALGDVPDAATLETLRDEFEGRIQHPDPALTDPTN